MAIAPHKLSKRQAHIVKSIERLGYIQVVIGSKSPFAMSVKCSLGDLRRLVKCGVLRCYKANGDMTYRYTTKGARRPYIMPDSD